MPTDLTYLIYIFVLNTAIQKCTQRAFMSLGVLRQYESVIGETVLHE